MLILQKIIKYLFIIGSFCFLTSAAVSADSDILGLWIPEEKDAVYEFFVCDDAICAKVAELKEPLDDQGKPRVDSLNEDETLRSRPIVGLQFLTGLKQKKKGRWGGGTIYNARDGKTYKASMKLKRDGTLVVRGFIGVSLIGKSTSFTRPE